MSKQPDYVVSFVERGWQGARECSLAMQSRNLPVTTLHIVKGCLTRDIRSIIEPCAMIRTISVPRQLFWPVVWLVVQSLALVGRLCAVLVDNNRSYRRVHLWGLNRKITVAKVWHRTPRGYDLWIDGQPAEVSDLYGALGGSCALP